MVVINTKTEQCFPNLSKTEVAKLVGVSRMTVTRWAAKNLKEGRNTEEYNNFTIYFRASNVTLV